MKLVNAVVYFRDYLVSKTTPFPPSTVGLCQSKELLVPFPKRIRRLSENFNFISCFSLNFELVVFHSPFTLVNFTQTGFPVTVIVVSTPVPVLESGRRVTRGPTP